MSATLPAAEAATPVGQAAGAVGIALRRVFSFPVAISGLLATLAVLTVRGRFNDPDTWWHLKSGQLIWTTRSIPNTDLFSFTTHHHATIPHEWLAQWALFGAYRLGGYVGSGYAGTGYVGMMFALWAVTAAVLIAGYTLCTFYSGNAKVSFLGALVLFVFSTSGLSLRPQLLGYLLLIVELLLIHLGRRKDARWFFALPPLFALWINCHGSFLLGLIVGGLIACSAFCHFRAGSLVAERWVPRTRNQLLLALALSLPALLVNPGGIGQILYPLDTMLHQPINLASIQEWQPLQLSSQRGICLLAVLGVLFLLIAARKAELFLDELLLLALGTWLVGSHERMAFVFGILAAPIVARTLAANWDSYDVAADRPLPNAILLALAVTVSYFAFPSAQNLEAQVAEQNPVKAVAYIRAHHLTGPMLNEYLYGGYLIWAAPEHPVFIDGRADLYEWAGVLGEFRDWETLAAPPNQLLDTYNIQFCLLAPQSHMTKVLPLMANWKATYADQTAVLFERVPTAAISRAR